MKLLNCLTLLGCLTLIACDGNDKGAVNGYMEGDFVYIAPSAAGVLDEILVNKGDEVTIGTPLFAVDTANLKADVDSANLSLSKAVSNYADLSKGKRSEEILVILKQKAQAEAALINAKQEYDRAGQLFAAQFGAKADLDLKKASLDQAQGRFDEVSATLKTAMLGARYDELKMAENEIEIAKQNLLKAQKRFADNHPVAKVAGRVEDTYYQPGETVASATPVVSILPPAKIKARFFVSQQQLPKFTHNQEVVITCDGCSQETLAKVVFVSSEAEFTPPMIYSVESRDKLVFMIDALPLEFNPELRPGLPVSIK